MTIPKYRLSRCFYCPRTTLTRPLNGNSMCGIIFALGRQPRTSVARRRSRVHRECQISDGRLPRIERGRVAANPGAQRRPRANGEEWALEHKDREPSGRYRRRHGPALALKSTKSGLLRGPRGGIAHWGIEQGAAARGAKVRLAGRGSRRGCYAALRLTPLPAMSVRSLSVLISSWSVWSSSSAASSMPSSRAHDFSVP